MSAMLAYGGPMPTTPQYEHYKNPSVDQAMDAFMARKGWMVMEVKADTRKGMYAVHGVAAPADGAEPSDPEAADVPKDDPMIQAILADMAKSRVRRGGYLRQPSDTGPEPETGRIVVEVEPRGLGALFARVGNAIGSLVARVRHRADQVEDGIEAEVKEGADAIEDTAETAVHEVGEAAEAVVDGVADGVADVATSVRNELDEMIDSLTDEARPHRRHGDTRLAENREWLQKGGPKKAVTAGHPDSVGVHDKAKASHIRAVRVVGTRVQATDSPAIRKAVELTNEAKQRALDAREAALRADRQVRDAKALGRHLKDEAHPTAEPERPFVAEVQKRAEARYAEAREAFYKAAEETASSRRLVHELRAEAREAKLSANQKLVADEPFALKGVLGHIAKASTSPVEAEELAKRTLDRYQEYLPRDPANAAVAAQRDALVEIARGGHTRKDTTRLAADALRAGRERAGAAL